ncbi:MAG: hypothetical protein F6K31_29590 [Symploca sp. SIO2G7]|nr:hypothetical protein [Symploca sp. SIO2G7]
MRAIRRVSETVNRGVTAVAMTIAIATVYAGIAAEGQMSHGDLLHHQLQTALQRPRVDPPQLAQESLPTVAMGTRTGWTDSMGKK